MRAHARVFALVGGENDVNGLCRTLAENGLGTVTVSVGERLSYEDENVTTGTAEELKDKAFAPLSAVLIQNDHPDAIVTHGLPDEAVFARRGRGRRCADDQERGARRRALEAPPDRARRLL